MVSSRSSRLFGWLPYGITLLSLLFSFLFPFRDTMGMDSWLPSWVLKGGLLLFWGGTWVHTIYLTHMYSLLSDEERHSMLLLGSLISLGMPLLFFLSRELMALPFVWGAIHILLGSYKATRWEQPFTYVGLLLGEAGLFCFTWWFLLPLFVLFVFKLRSNSWSHFMALFIGALFPPIMALLGSYLFFSDLLPSLLYPQVEWGVVPHFSILQWGFLILFGCLFVGCSFAVFFHPRPDRVATRTYITTLWWFCFYLWLCSVVVPGAVWGHVLIQIPLVSLLLVRGVRIRKSIFRKTLVIWAFILALVCGLDPFLTDLIQRTVL